MADPQHPSTLSRSPRVSTLGLWLALFGAPATWALLTVSVQTLAAYGCFPKYEPVTRPVLPHLAAWIWSLSGLGVIIGLTTIGLAWRLWRIVHRPLDKSRHEVFDVASGRERFLTWMAVMTSVGFTVAMVFETAAVWLVDVCGSAAS
ncbi:MAG: hypothetical protein ACRYG5_03130 [Janthinobacterium lividum]